MRTRTFKILDWPESVKLSSHLKIVYQFLVNLSDSGLVKVNKNIIAQISTETSYTFNTVKAAVTSLKRHQLLLLVTKQSGKYNANMYGELKSGSKEYARAVFIKSSYGLSIEDYDNIAQSQDWKCAICLKPETELLKRLNIDHCHRTGHIRGLLCWDCNTALGKFKDKVESLERAIKYLKKNLVN